MFTLIPRDMGPTRTGVAVSRSSMVKRNGDAGVLTASIVISGSKSSYQGGATCARGFVRELTVQNDVIVAC